MSIRHIQKTEFYCCKCRKFFTISTVEVLDGNDFCKYNPTAYGWNELYLNGKRYLLCPKHKIQLIVDGERL